MPTERPRAAASPPSADASAQRGRSEKPQEEVGLPSHARFCHAFMRRHPCGNSECDVPRAAPPPQPGNAEPETDEDAYDEPDDTSEWGGAHECDEDDNSTSVSLDSFCE